MPGTTRPPNTRRRPAALSSNTSWRALFALSVLVLLACSEEASSTPGAPTAGTAGALAGASGAAASFAPTAGTTVAGGAAGTAGIGGATAGAPAPVAGAAPMGGAAAAPSAGAGGVDMPRAGSAGGTAGETGAEAGAGGAAGAAGDAGGAATPAAGTGGMVEATGGAGTEAPSTFTPCPLDEACRILPLGDSITDGIGFSGGYRVELFHLALTDGKSITYVGGSMNGPSEVDGVSFPRNHEGHSGWTIEQIDGLVPAPALEPDPHIVLLHIGTNDMYRTPQGAPERLGDLIDQIVDALPDALLVVAKIIPFPGAASAVDTFNAGVVDVVQARIDDGKHVVLVDQFTGFPTSELGDGVHPNQTGYARMAGVWYEAIKDELH